METNLEWTNKHPISNVQWIEISKVYNNDYNPNVVANPEIELLEVSIKLDGFTQPIVVWQTGTDEYEIVDGAHRFIIAKKLELTHVPVVIVNRVSRNNRITSTIRHNRARGKHTVLAMRDIVIELSRNGMTDEKISKELGMDNDEILRLKQMAGLAEMFSDKEFSKAWEEQVES